MDTDPVGWGCMGRAMGGWGMPEGAPCSFRINPRLSDEGVRGDIAAAIMAFLLIVLLAMSSPPSVMFWVLSRCQITHSVISWFTV